MIIKIAQSQVVGLEISKTQILHENINKSGYKNLKNKRHVRMKDMRITHDFIAPNKESFLTTTCAKS
ncbi:dnaK suppressor protein [Helicobacter pylori Hp H-11]|nr:dnaK suppressor protein [Helicobacter pylori Hp H-11]